MRPGPLTDNLAAKEQIISILPGDMLAVALALVHVHLVSVGPATVETALFDGAGLRDTTVGTFWGARRAFFVAIGGGGRQGRTHHEGQAEEGELHGLSWERCSEGDFVENV